MPIDVSNSYTLRASITTGSAITLLQLAPSTGVHAHIWRISVTQPDDTAERATVTLATKSAAATVTAAIVGTTLMKHDLSSDSPTPSLDLDTDATGHTASAEGTNGNTLWQEDFDIRLGALFAADLANGVKPFKVPSGTVVGLRFLNAPTSSHTWSVSMDVTEGD